VPLCGTLLPTRNKLKLAARRQVINKFWLSFLNRLRRRTALAVAEEAEPRKRLYLQINKHTKRRELNLLVFFCIFVVALVNKEFWLQAWIY
jgi:hypothetical protein